MPFAYLSILALALLFAGLAHRDAHIRHGDVMHRAWKQLAPLLVRLPIALIAASFIGELIPQALFGRWLGDSSGLNGILIASLLGGIMPGGPMVTFPLILVFERAGVGVPQLIALLTSWSCFALHRVLSYELPTLGWPFVWRRWAVTLILAPLAGLLTLWFH
ncbi:hypothetical protein [Spiribacter insolitus]|uniref:Permease n=1 Tax=Spiribacter insolitus TaxID=3122417 RepID=A0ABV3T529_9GAMM